MNDRSDAAPPGVTEVTHRLAAVRDRVRRALLEARRSPGETAILAVSKQHTAAAIEALAAAGQREFGENFVQEAMAKIAALQHLEIDWHFIGHIQSNKTRDIAEHFGWVHTVDRMRVARRLNAQRPYYREPLNVCIQVNQAHEPQKGGIAPGGAADLARGIMELSRLRLRGLMSLPPAAADPAQSIRFFAALRQLKQRLTGEGIPMDTLSMGMSFDLEGAVREGSTIVRVGTAIFGPRARKTDR